MSDSEEMSDSELVWFSESESEDRMFDPDYYNPADHEDVAFNIAGALEFWRSDKKGTIIGDVFANSLKSLEKKEASEPCREIVRIVTDKYNKTLSFIDNGVGMTKEELEGFGSGGGRELLSVADKVVVTTKHDLDNEYVMVLSPEEDKKIGLATQEDRDLLFRGKRRGTKITIFVKQDEVEHLLDFTTYRVLADIKFSTKIDYHVFFFSKEGDVVNATGFVQNSNSLFKGSYHINEPAVKYLVEYTLPFHLL